MKSIGVDFGGTKISTVLVTDNGKVLKRNKFPTGKGRKKILNNLARAIDSVYDKDAKGIGVGIPGIAEKGVITWVPNVKGMENFNIKKFLEKKYRIKIVIENDANCFASAENKFGAGKGSKNMVGITLGTGVGAGIIINGELYTGENGGAGEVGHAFLYPIDVRNMKSKYELATSGTAVEKEYYKITGKKLLPSEIFRSKDKYTKKVTEDFKKHLILGLANVINWFNPKLIVLGGSVSNFNFYDEINKKVKIFSVTPNARKVKVVKNKLGSDAGVIGAGILVFNREN